MLEALKLEAMVDEDRWKKLEVWKKPMSWLSRYYELTKYISERCTVTNPTGS